ncbi:MAG TPA: transposase [Roseiflexaceae bacterium]
MPLGAEAQRACAWEEAPCFSGFSPLLAQTFDLYYYLTIVKLTIQLKLLPTAAQADALRRTLSTANAACDYISAVAWQTRTFGKFALQKLCYQEVRETFNLTAQMVIRALSKVADAYKLDTNTKRTFRSTSAIAYDDRILSFAIPDSSVSIWTMDGRAAIAFACGTRHKALLASRRGQTDLACVGGNWYLFATCEVDEPDPLDVDDVLGVDLGVTNIAVDSDGQVHSGKAIKNVRYRHRQLRNKLQRKGTLGSHRRLWKLAGQERRFAKHVNHTLSKRIVATAKRTKRAIALENLTHIRTRVRARKSQRAALHSWAFAQLRAFIVYKAALEGVAVHFVDPRNTSRRCPSCGHCAKENRKTQSSFVCLSCGFAGLADRIAAENIRVLGRAVVSQPDYSDASGAGSARVKPKRLGLE